MYCIQIQTLKSISVSTHCDMNIKRFPSSTTCFTRVIFSSLAAAPSVSLSIKQFIENYVVLHNVIYKNPFRKWLKTLTFEKRQRCQFNLKTQ